MATSWSAKADIQITDTLMKLKPGDPHCIAGRAVVVHVGQDDLGKGGFEDSLTVGHAGGRLACGIIGYTHTFPAMKA